MKYFIFALFFLFCCTNAISQPDNTYLTYISNIPSEYGTLFETNIADNEKTDIIVIYDMHCRPDVQKNIYSIINYITSNFNTTKIFIEGTAKGKTNLSSVMNIEPKEIRNNIINKMLNKGLLNGAEYYCYIKEHDILYGLEDFSLYLSTVKKSFHSSMEGKQFLNNIKKSEKDLYKLKKQHYNNSMKIYDDIFCSRQNNIKDNYKEIENIKYLSDNYYKDIQKIYPNIFYLINIADYEKIIPDHETLQKDFYFFIDTAKNKIPFSVYSKLLLQLQNKNIDEQILTVYSSVAQFTEKEKFSYIENIKNKNDFIKQFSLNGYLKEKDLLKNELYDKIFTQSVAGDISFLSRMLYLLKQYVSLEITFDDLNELNNNTDKFIKLISDKMYIKNKDDITAILNSETLKIYYENNVKRNDIFISNILEELDKNNLNIIVTGGFHKELINIFNEQNIKYILITPATFSGDNKLYRKIISNIALRY